MKYRVPIYRISMVREGEIPFEQNSMHGPRDVVPVVKAMCYDMDREGFWVILLNCRKKIIGINTVSIGHLTASLVHPREVFKPAILANASCIILAHNHPSGDPTPSQEDMILTKRLKEAGETLGIEILDHVIVGDGSHFYSFQEHNTF
jgi:DNA repair protein RadC